MPECGFWHAGSLPLLQLRQQQLPQQLLQVSLVQALVLYLLVPSLCLVGTFGTLVRATLPTMLWWSNWRQKLSFARMRSQLFARKTK